MSWPLSIGFVVVSTRRENLWRKYLNVKKLYASFRDPGAPDEPSLPPPRVVLSIIIQKPIYACITPPPCLYTPLALATLPTTLHFEEANIIIGFCLWQQQSCLTRKAWWQRLVSHGNAGFCLNCCFSIFSTVASQSFELLLLNRELRILNRESRILNPVDSTKSSNLEWISWRGETISIWYQTSSLWICFQSWGSSSFEFDWGSYY